MKLWAGATVAAAGGGDKAGLNKRPAVDPDLHDTRRDTRPLHDAGREKSAP
ncbi:hypothetical protein PCL1606_42730 [Pseudomonas chlororaphis]|uniref:Uncharacterized protein n=1 Tax=Pseudomonas chlororaphis TaxID=587753 RepID=A0A0D5Y3V8_9PSED|nr:hypothetical protein PCL1606_42730 [Pseudomonas chlororaphis]